MRFRGKSIRRKIVALLLVPLVSLTALWGFSTYLTGRQAGGLMDVAHIVKKVGYPIEDTVRVLQQERRQTLVYLADQRPSDALASLRGRRAATDAALARIRAAAHNPNVRDDLKPAAKERLKTVLDGFDSLPGLRQSVEQGTVDRPQALDFYNRLIDPCYGFLTNLHALENVEMDKQGRALVGITRAREMLSREDALVASSLITPRTTAPELRRISDLVANRRLLYETDLENLPRAERDRFEQYWSGPDTEALRTAEAALLDAGPAKDRHIDATRWQQAATPVLDRLAQMGTQAGNRYQDRVEPVAFNVVMKAVLAGVLGLLALLVSLFMSVRIGRELVRDLTRLRKEAHEASGVRLPSVMRRLAAGEQVDVETEAPRLDYERDEVGQVGQALNTLQRAAVEAAVKQADMRRGVSEVFVNLARRNQVLLHRQLTLLDAMERRTEDTDELADLFRLDHLTTRMRRHAEGLVILSGAAASRQWRKPVQLMDVVRAAVAEVEDYERIEVRRLPRLGVGGPAVADLTHLIAELLENATVFSPPHTAVQVHGERVANGFTLEIHDRGLGMAPEILLDANLRLAETPEFELSDTDRLGLFVVSRLAQRQNVRVSLQPSPYGGTTAVVFIPATLLTDAPETEGTGFRLDRKAAQAAQGDGRSVPDAPRRALSPLPVGIPGQSVLDGPVELEPSIDPLGFDEPSVFEAPVGREGIEAGRSGLLRSARRAAGSPDERQQHAQAADEGEDHEPLPLPRRLRVPTLVSDNGRRVDGHGRGHPASEPEPAPQEPRAFESRLPERRASQPPRPGDSRAEPSAPQPLRPAPRPSGLTPVRPAGLAEPSGSGPANPADLPGAPSSAPSWGSLPEAPPEGGAPLGRRLGASPDGEAQLGGLPRRVRQASLAPQLKAAEGHHAASATDEGPDPERDADEVRDRMASLQRGWQRGRRYNDASDTAEGPSAPARGDTARRTTPEGDGR